VNPSRGARRISSQLGPSSRRIRFDCQRGVITLACVVGPQHGEQLGERLGGQDFAIRPWLRTPVENRPATVPEGRCTGFPSPLTFADMLICVSVRLRAAAPLLLAAR
jgi:hypothetical protein